MRFYRFGTRSIPATDLLDVTLFISGLFRWLNRLLTVLAAELQFFFLL
jgi:hypothetical protein